MENKLYILCGIPFSGKTTLAKKLVEKLGFTRIDLDDIKFELFGKDIMDPQIDQTGWDKVFRQMYREIKQSLAHGKTVVHDTGNFTFHERSLVKHIADELGLESITIFVDIPEKEAHKRLIENRQTKTRFDVVDEDFQSSVNEMEPPGNDERHLIFNWKDNVDKWVENYLAH